MCACLKSSGNCVPAVVWCFLYDFYFTSWYELLGVIVFCNGPMHLGRCWYMQVWHLWTPLKRCRYSENVRTNTCALYDPVCFLFAVARIGLSGPCACREFQLTHVVALYVNGLWFCVSVRMRTLMYALLRCNGAFSHGNLHVNHVKCCANGSNIQL